jgi:ribonuclease HI
VCIPELNVRVCKRLNDYAAEFMAMIIGLKSVEEVKPLRVVIYSDSAAVLSSVKVAGWLGETCLWRRWCC